MLSRMTPPTKDLDVLPLVVIEIPVPMVPFGCWFPTSFAMSEWVAAHDSRALGARPGVLALPGWIAFAARSHRTSILDDHREM